jgi:hypothetical protein
LHFAAAIIAAALLIIGVPIIAWRIGGPAERWGAALNSFLTFAILAIQIITRDARPNIPFLAADFLLATGFLVLALRYSNIWLGVAMLLQSAELTLNAVTLSAQRELTAMDALITNLISLAIVATILGGAWANLRRTRQTPRTRAT